MSLTSGEAFIVNISYHSALFTVAQAISYCLLFSIQFPQNNVKLRSSVIVIVDQHHFMIEKGIVFYHYFYFNY